MVVVAGGVGVAHVQFTPPKQAAKLGTHRDDSATYLQA